MQSRIVHSLWLDEYAIKHLTSFFGASRKLVKLL
jgi:hypothetical protein